MHVVIGFITALAGLFWALNSLENSGFRLSSLNPFHWHRRRQWRKIHAQNPLYTLEKPMDSAAAVLLGIAKLEGEISKEHKSEILNIFSQEFNLSAEKAKDLFASTSFLLQSESNFLKNIDKVLASSSEKYSQEQSVSTVELVTKIAQIESDVSVDQRSLIESVKKILMPHKPAHGKW